ncbi:hypothetical protein [Bradyrhizobium sp. RDM4]|uniref:hypothetical protein n=1 Tax=Bradyrhizobium sp. RDM4 TaxID=3378765 RepID=UPI0038FBEAA0
MIRKLGLKLLGATVVALVATASFAQDGQTHVGAHRHKQVSPGHQSQKGPQAFRNQFALMPLDNRGETPSDMPGAQGQPAQF